MSDVTQAGFIVSTVVSTSEKIVGFRWITLIGPPFATIVSRESDDER